MGHQFICEYSNSGRVAPLVVFQESIKSHVLACVPSESLIRYLVKTRTTLFVIFIFRFVIHSESYVLPFISSDLIYITINSGDTSNSINCSN